MTEIPFREISLLILGTLSTFLIWRIQHQKEKIKNIESQLSDRKYKMYSKFGDYYDHIADIFKFVSVLYTLFYINYVKFLTFIPSILFYFILFNIHLGYQEIYYDKNDSDILNIVKNICLITISNKDNKITILHIMSYTRYFGCGTFNLIMMLFIIFYGM